MAKLFNSEESLSLKIAKGGFWTLAFRVIERGLGFLRLIIVARLLAPDDFGLFGIALLSISILENFSDTGFQAALVQKKENIENYLNTAWTISILRGIILFIILFISAPYVGIFFGREEASLIIRIIGVTILLRSFNNIGMVYFKKELQFDRLFIFNLTSSVIEFIVTVWAAFILKSVWALVLGIVVKSISGLIVSYWLQPYRPSFDFSYEKSKKLFSFGKWVLGSNVLIFLVMEADDAFVGKFLGITALGFYQMAYRISNIPATEIGKLSHQLTFPAYSKMQDNLPRLKEAYSRALEFIAFLSFPLAGLIFITAPDFTKLFLGEKWMPMVPALQVLSLWGLVRSLGAAAGSLMYAVGKPKLLTKFLFYQLLLMIILIYPLTMQLGIMGTSLAVLIASVIPNGISVYYATIKIAKCKILDMLKIIGFPFISTLAALASVFLLNFSRATQGQALQSFASSILIFCSVYFLITLFYNKFTTYKILPMVRNFFFNSTRQKTS